MATQRLLPAGCKCFSYSELASATNNFSDASVIGEGGFGRVYRGTLPGGLPIAVKLLDRRGLQVVLSPHFLLLRDGLVTASDLEFETELVL